MDRDAGALVARLRESPATTAILLDFDGTLAAIVDDPAAAAPPPGVPEVLDALVGVYSVVAVISGRPVAFLTAHLGSGPTLVGLYGLERRVGGETVVSPDAAHWRDIVERVAAEARVALPPVVGVEHKGLSLTIHLRTAPEHAAEVGRWATAAAGRSGLQVRHARRSVELHPPVHADKGTVASELVGDVTAACFIGDDVGDLPAFDALDALAARVRIAVRLAVSSPELDPALRARADGLVDGPSEVLAILRELAR